MADGHLIFDTKIDQTGFVKGTRQVVSNVNTVKTSLKSLAKVAAAAFSVRMAANYAKAAKEAYNVQVEAETKLATIMKQRMGATDDVIDSIKELASEQQKLGVIGDEVQLAGAQQIATFVTQAETIKTLLPAMNNLLAQQRGLNASTGDAVNIGNLMGKVLQGQTSALKRVGISFSDAEEQVLKYGTESERAAMLAQVITNNVGRMNQALAQTDAGKQTQLANTMGDIKEQFGQAVQQIESVFLPVLARLVSGLSRAASVAQEFSAAFKDAFGIENSSGATEIASSASQAADSYSDIADEAERAQEAQEGSLASFDKVIKLNNSEEASASAAGGTSVIGGTASPTNAAQTTSSWLTSLKQSLQNGDWNDIGSMFAKKTNEMIAKIKFGKAGRTLGDGITNAFKLAYAYLSQTKWNELGGGLADFLNGIISETDFNLVGRTFAARLNALWGFAFGFVSKFNFKKAGLSVGDFINGWIDEFDAAQVAKTASRAATGILNFISSALKRTNWRKVGNKVSEFINSIEWGEILRSLVDVIIGIIKATPQLLRGIVESLDFENAAALFGLLFAPKMAAKLLTTIKTNSAVKSSLGETGESVGSQIGGATATGLQKAVAGIQAAIIGWQIGTIIYNAAKPGIDKITNELAEAFNVDREIAATEAYMAANRSQRIADYKQRGATWLTSSSSDYEVNYVAPLMLRYAAQYQDAGVTAKSAYDQYQGLLWAAGHSGYEGSAAEQYIEAQMLEWLRKKSRQSDLAKGIASIIATNHFGIPGLASGTVVPANYGQFAAILGDNKREPEVVSPLSTMKQALAEVIAEQGKQPIVLNVTIDTRRGSKLLSQQVIDDINDIINTTGNVPINL